MSSNETDAFDALMNQHNAGKVAEEESPGNDAPASAEVELVEPSLEEEALEVPDDEDEDETPEEETPEEEAPEEEPRKGKKQTAQERIAEVVAKQRQAEREVAKERSEKEDLFRRLQALEAKLEGTPQREAPNPVPSGNEFGLVEPTENDLDASGEPKYPLGSFDPTFMRDINRYDRAVEKAYEAKVNDETRRQSAAMAEEQKMIDDWNVRLAETEKTSPKIREKAQSLVDALDDSDPQHMQVLAQTIMTLDNGPSVLEYLSDNLDEANKISRMPTNKALLHLGRLDGLFVISDDAGDDEPEELTPVRATQAPAPAKLARGSGTGKGGAPSLYDKMLKDFR